ncbi:biopolymer transporter ExbD [Shimia sp. R11_0]|uniref:ExbD/TolR family protein n=1 Tax=Shimia sp. R11_0 TaxID=2821096 RepID=UPI001ADC197F|nr:biopolymer transporter ExbD [Shimia sp. R11_0]MBO9476697.1 biopolymer transporter ExbD [Shimia sp. R11_0]
MQIDKPHKRPKGESIVPMINVVFLLLIFFLMTSRLVEPAPFKVTPPTAASEKKPEAEPVMFLDKDGTLSFEGAEAEAAIANVKAISGTSAVIRLRADQRVPSSLAAKVLSDLAVAGLSNVELIVVPQ